MLHGGILGATTYKHGQPKVLPIFSAFSSEMVVVFVSVCLLLMLGSQRPPPPSWQNTKLWQWRAGWLASVLGVGFHGTLCWQLVGHKKGLIMCLLR